MALLVVGVAATFAGAASAAPSKRDKEPPSTPTNLVGSSATASTITFTWTASTDNVGVAGYDVFVNSARAARVSTTSYTVSGLSCGTTVTVTVAAFDRTQNRSPVATATGSTSGCGDVQAPTAPTGLTITARSGTSVTLSWNASNDNVGVAGYGYYVGTNRVGTTTNTSVVVDGLTCGNTYALGVRAYDAADNWSGMTTVNASTSTCADTTPPSTPTGLTISSPTQSGVTLSWTASNDNVGVVGYYVYQGPTQLGSTPGTSFPIAGLSCGASYTVSVAAYDAAGNTSPLASTQATTATCSGGGGGGEPGPIAGLGYHQVFRDDFDTLNRTVWDNRIWYDGLPSASWANFQYAANGILHLASTRAWGYPDNTVTTQVAGLRYQQGYFEARMRWTGGRGAWPGFWLLSWRHATNPAYPSINPYCALNGLVPALCYSAELDVFEGQGAEPRSFYGTSHRNSCGCYGLGDQQNGNNWRDAGVDLTADFHTYGMLWTATQITWYLDGGAMTSTSVYDSTNQPMFLLLQMWTGGWTGGPDSSTPATIETQVDYVQVWQK